MRLPWISYSEKLNYMDRIDSAPVVRNLSLSQWIIDSVEYVFIFLFFYF